MLNVEPDRLPAEELIDQGAAALRAGERRRARELLAAAVRADPRSARAWLWLSGAIDDPGRQRECLERALALDPGSISARRGLEALRAGGRGQGAGGLLLLSGAVAALLWAVGGVSLSLAWAAWRNLGDEVSPAQLLVLALLAGAPLGLAGLIVAGVLLRISGRWLGGRGGAATVRAGLGWAAAPQAIGLALWVGQALLVPAASFSGAAVPPGQQAAATVLGAAHGLLGLCSAALAVAGLAAAHRTSLWRAAAAWLLAALLVLGAIAAAFAGSALMITLRGG